MLIRSLHGHARHLIADGKLPKYSMIGIKPNMLTKD
jgi:hypothetical protein